MHFLDYTHNLNRLITFFKLPFQAFGQKLEKQTRLNISLIQSLATLEPNSVMTANI